MISFVVPAFNEELELPATIAAIRQAALAGAAEPFEIIVVDDGSTDATAELAERLGASVVSINRRHIAAARNAGARAAKGDVLFFVDADTRISALHVSDAVAALKAGCSGGGAYVRPDGFVPMWGRIFVALFSFFYFRLKLGAGAFLFTTKSNFDAVGGFDEQYFAGEEIYFSLALRKLGRFMVLTEPVLSSGRKLRMYSAGQVTAKLFSLMIRGPGAARSRKRLDLWYSGKRENRGHLPEPFSAP